MENKELYIDMVKENIDMVKENIDNCIKKNDYSKAFGCLIISMKRLNENEKNDIIEYYNNKILINSWAFE
jgi:hypothetical protein